MGISSKCEKCNLGSPYKICRCGWDKQERHYNFSNIDSAVAITFKWIFMIIIVIILMYIIS